MKKRDLFRDGFTADDFAPIFVEGIPRGLAAYQANELLKKAMTESKRVYGLHDGYNWHYGTNKTIVEDTHTALLICEEEIKK